MKKLLFGLWCIFIASPAHAVDIIINKYYVVQLFEFISVTPTHLQTLQTPPPSISVTFSLPPDPNSSTVTLLNPYNQPITPEKIEINNTAITLTLAPFARGSAGTYRIEWNATCLCKERTKIKGRSMFSIL